MQDKPDGPRFEGTDFVVGAEGSARTFDAKFLISVLLVYVAKGDGEIDEAETDRMLDIITRRFDATGAQAMALLTDAIRTFTDGTDLVEQLRRASAGLSEAERSDIFGMLLEVMLADGELAEGEISHAEFAGAILGLSLDRIHAGIRAARS